MRARVDLSKVKLALIADERPLKLSGFKATQIALSQALLW